MIDVLIAIVFIYLSLAVVCSAVQEMISGALSWRSRTLHAGICALLHDPKGEGIVKQFYDHPLIRSFKICRFHKPSYIPNDLFVTTLIDLIAPAEHDAKPLNIQNLRNAVGQFDANDDLRRSLSVLISDEGETLQTAKDKIERWFVEGMNRTSEIYKRRAGSVIFSVALFVTLALNADTVQIVQTLSQNAGIRSLAVKKAESEAATKTLMAGLIEAKNPEETVKDVDLSFLDLGWEKPGEAIRHVIAFAAMQEKTTADAFACVYYVVKKIIGLGITTLAVAMGAPFWFELLNKIVNLRNTGKKQEERIRA
jgi:hypothetical protein